MAQKPIPRPYSDSLPFWQGTKARQLWIQKCLQCGEFQFYPRGVCKNCLSSALSWFQSLGAGEIYSFTVNHRAPHPGFVDDLPFITALVDLDEGVRLMTNIIECTPDEVQIGMRVRAVYEDVDEEITLLKFKPV